MSKEVGNGVSVKDHIESLFDEFKERYLSDRESDLRAFESFKEGLDDKDKERAKDVERRLTAYPTTQDFNVLKEQVTIQFTSELSRGKVISFIMGIVALVIAAVAVLIAYQKT